MHHVLSAEQFSPDELEEIFERADYYREHGQVIADRREVLGTHSGRIMLSMFYEASTRTRFSFEIAAARLGMAVVGTENAAEFSSAAKGESIEDTIRVFNEYGVDVISLRTKEEGHANMAASVSDVPIINGGDGKGEHPSQAVLDVYTIKKQLKRLGGLHVVMGGDLAHGRTVKSLAKLLSSYAGNHYSFVSSPELQIGTDIKLSLRENGTTFEETTDMHHVLRNADVVYWLRLQSERHDRDKKEKLSIGQEHFILGATALEILPKTAIIMHPLPRNEEIPTSTDADPRAIYFRQAGNGLYVRMAMLDMIMRGRP